MSATTLIERALNILDNHGYSGTPDQHIDKATAVARIATAQALSDLADAARTDANQPAFPTQTTWPAGVTARILTHAGVLLRDPNATVDIHDDKFKEYGRSIATCRPCGWTKGHGLTYRTQVLDWAHEHAATCAALPNPAA